MIRIFRQYISPRKALFVCGEGLLIFLAVSLASFAMLHDTTGFFETIEAAWPKILVVALITQISLYFNDLYEFKNTSNAIELATRLVRSIGLTSVALAILYYLWPAMIIGRWIFFGSLVVLLLFLVSWRFLYVFVIKKKLLSDTAIILGNGDLAQDILEEMGRTKDISYNVACLVAPNGAVKSDLTKVEATYGPLRLFAHETTDDRPQRTDIRLETTVVSGQQRILPTSASDPKGQSPILSPVSSKGAGEARAYRVMPPEALPKAQRSSSPEGTILTPNAAEGVPAIPLHYGFDGLCELAEAEKVDSVIVALDEKRGILPYKELLRCKLKGVDIIDGEGFYERISGKLLVEKINPSWLIFSDGFVKSRSSRLIKRLVGLIMASGMLVTLFPIMVLVAIAIKLESRGPILFSQERVGEYGKLFTLYKFRSMRADAEKMTGPVWATEDDPRVTRVGKIIRKLRIDELPQLWNVFTGDMSFVGPRPERPFFVEELKKKIPYFNERGTVKPGVTGWAQIKYPYGASEKDALEKLKYDLYYIKNMSLLMDMVIIFQTVKTVLLGRGAR